MRLTRFCIAIMCVLLFAPSAMFAGDASSRQEIENLIESKGADLYRLAWSTARFTGVDIKSIDQTAGNDSVTAIVVLRGTSTFTGDEIWVRARIKLDDGDFVDLKWEKHSPVFFPPGSTVSDLPARLRNLNKKPLDPAEAEALRKEWERFSAVMDAKFDNFYARQKRLIEERARKQLGNDLTYLTFQTSPGCHVSVAIYFKALDGQWVTIGWHKAYYPGDEDYYVLRHLGSYVWLYAKSTKGRLYGRRQIPEETLELPVIRERSFIREGNEELKGPSLEIVPFYRVYTGDVGPGSNVHAFGCSP